VSSSVQGETPKGTPMPPSPNRRLLLTAAFAGWPALLLPALARAQATSSAHDDNAAAPPLTNMIADPLLVHSLYRVGVSHDYLPNGAAGANANGNGYQYIEEQRQGVEWIVRGFAQRRAEWMQLGWTQLDWGVERQQPDGSFGSKDPFHSTSFFIEALARACIIDNANATPARVQALGSGARWLMSRAAEDRGVPNNRPYTHRRYILAAAFGQSAVVTGDASFAKRAQQWAEEGLSLQREDGTNPEKDGYDVGYQMVGVLMALHYLPVCQNASLRAKLRAMIRRATQPEIDRMAADGSISLEDSTRVGKEHSRSGKLKDVPYGEILQALVYGAQALPEPQWMEPARKIALLRGWLKT
jgi:hypothetical protein